MYKSERKLTEKRHEPFHVRKQSRTPQNAVGYTDEHASHEICLELAVHALAKAETRLDGCCCGPTYTSGTVKVVPLPIMLLLKVLLA